MTTITKDQVLVTRNNTSEVTQKIVTISPEMAAVKLAIESGTGIEQRTTVHEDVVYLAKQMLDDKWDLQYEPIIESPCGFVMDGRHRLCALVLSNTSQVFLVISGVDESLMPKIGLGKRRTPGNVLQMSHYTNVNVLAATLRGLSRYHDKGTFKRYGGRRETIPPYEYLKLAERWPQAVQAVSYAESHRGENLLRSSVVALLYVIFGEIDIHTRNDFFARLISGAGLEANSPILLCRKELIDLRLLQEKWGFQSVTKKTDTIALVVKAWNAIRSGETPKKITYHFSEPFPMPI